MTIAKKFTNSTIFKSTKPEMKLRQLSSSISPNEKLCKGREAYYIFSASSNDKGFVIVSGDRRMPDVLAYSDENSFDADNIPPNVRYWLDCYVETFLSLDNATEWAKQNVQTATILKEIAPLLDNNKWDQGDPYNRLCPTTKQEKCLTGCVATAMAQVMKYHGYPSTGKGNISYTTEKNNIHINHDFSLDQFEWEYMLDDYSGKFTSEQANAVAELMYSCGTSVKMDYGTIAQDGSGAMQKDLVTAFVNNFNYDQDAALMIRDHCNVEDWHRLLMKELEEGRPVNYGGRSIFDGGHSFVLDGYRFRDGNKYPDYHVNWGWSGNCNGYYQIADLHPEDDGQLYTKSAFANNQQMTINIKPEDYTDDGIFYICTSNLNVSLTTAKAGSTVQVYTASCVNLSYKNFNGTLHVALIPSDEGDTIILGENNIRKLAYTQEQSNVSIEINLPSELPKGQYIVQLRSKQLNTDKYNPVFSRKYPSIEIEEKGGDNPIPNIKNTPLLGSSELELLNASDSSMIRLNIYELQNLSETSFIGDLRMILTDKRGSFLCAFGDSIQPGELSMYEIQENPLNIQGELIGDWPEGNYRIYIGARLINTSKYVYVSFYDIAHPDKSNQELYLDARIERGKLIINGKSYEIVPSSISNNRIMRNYANENIYYLDGTKHDIFKSDAFGIYIVNGRKVFHK